MNTKNFATIQKMKEVHKSLLSRFKDNQQDIQLAKDLEEFFNYIVYDTDKATLNDTNMFNKNLNEELRNQLRNSPYIQKLNELHNVGGQKQLSGQAGEEAISFLLLQAIQNIEQSPILNTNIEKLVDQMITGQWQATTATEGLAKEIIDKAIQINNKNPGKGFNSLRKKYGVFGLRQGKVDIDTGQLILDHDFSSKAKQLLNLTTSVKNYQRATIHLETVNRQKAYQGIMATLYPDLSGHATQEIYNYYYEKQKDKNNDFLSEHFLHIVNLYALTGLGQMYFDKINYQTVTYSLGARFLIANISSLRKIIVVPTAEIAANIAKPKYMGLFTYEGKETKAWENQRSLPVYLNLQKYKNLTK